MKSNKKNSVVRKAPSAHIATSEHLEVVHNDSTNTNKDKSTVINTKNEMKSETKNNLKGKGKLASTKKREDGVVNLKVNLKDTTVSIKGRDKEKEKEKGQQRDKDKDRLLTPKSVRKDRPGFLKKKGQNVDNTNITNTLNTNRESVRLNNSPKKRIEGNERDKDGEKGQTKKKTKIKKAVPGKVDAALSSRTYRDRYKTKTFWKSETKKGGDANKKLRRSKSCFHPSTSKTDLQQTHIKFSDISDEESNLENMSVEDNIDIEQNKKEVTEKVLNKYKNSFDKYKETVIKIFQGDTSDSLKPNYTRSKLNHLLKLSWRCINFKLSVPCAILLLLDRLNNPETELTDNEKENIENNLRSYGNKVNNSYKYICKLQYKKTNKKQRNGGNDEEKDEEKDEEEEAEDGQGEEEEEKQEEEGEENDEDQDIDEYDVDDERDELEDEEETGKKKSKKKKLKRKQKQKQKQKEDEKGKGKEKGSTKKKSHLKFQQQKELEVKEDSEEDLKMKKEIFNNLRINMKNIFLLNFEMCINLINCILYTIDHEEQKVYFLHLRAQLYKFTSDITETAVKYKYEKLAQESYEEALVIANKCCEPTNISYLNLIYNYIYFLYFVTGEEQDALDLSKDAFEKATDALEQIENDENVEKCLQILSRMRYNIKRWTYKLHKDMLLYIKF